MTLTWATISVAIAQENISSKFIDRITLHLAEDPSQGFAVGFRTSFHYETAYIEVAHDQSTPELKPIVSKEASKYKFNASPEEAYYFKVAVEGLKENTSYVYRVGQEDTWSEWFSVSTGKSNDNSFSFIYLGDIQNDIKSLASRVVRKSYQQTPNASFMLYAGDLINRTHNDQEWGEWYEAGAWIHAQVPILATPGNHEYTRDEARNLVLDKHWDKQFNFPKNGPAPYQSSVYFQDYGNMRIFCLDSQLIMLDSAAREVQLAWLEEQLKATTHTWKLVLMHHPIYSVSDNRDNQVLRERFQPLFENYGVDLVLQGHDHTYGRGFKPNVENEKAKGPMYIVSVAGPKMYSPTLDRWMERSGANLQLYQSIQVENNKLSYACFTTDGVKYDGFDLTKNASGTAFREHKNLDLERNQLPIGRLEKLNPKDIPKYNKLYHTTYED